MNIDVSLNWLLVISGFILIAMELFVGVQTGFDLVIIGLSLLAGGIVGNLGSNSSLGIVVATVLLFLYVLIGRKLIKQKLVVITRKTNVDSLIGKTGIVITEITPNKKGQVAIDGEVWLAAASQKLAVKSAVKVQSVEGVTANVAKDV